MKTPIYDKLQKLREENRIAFHMPGHKRKEIGAYPRICGYDITEIKGYDDLHHPEGIIRESMDELKKVYGTRESWYLVGGSTLGILVSIGAVCKPGDTILIGRNCHKAVYHAAELLHLKVRYCYPDYDRKFQVSTHIRPGEVERCLQEYSRGSDHEEGKISCIVIPSPTYEGIVSDITRIADLSHRYDIPLIVDEAHGAHLKFHESFPKSAVDCGADLVIQSTHKTLPAMTQTALLHLCSERVRVSDINRMIDIFETSSPSYILLSSAEYSVSYMQNNVHSVEKYVDKLSDFRDKCQGFRNICLINQNSLEVYDFDPGKILLSVRKKMISGGALSDLLFDRFQIETEAACSSYCILMTSVADEEKDFETLYQAFESIDRLLDQEKYRKKEPGQMETGPVRGNRVMEIWQALELAGREGGSEILFPDQGEGRISASYVMLYPPGIPILVPGEKISREMAEVIEYYLLAGYNIIGMEENKLRVLSTDE